MAVETIKLFSRILRVFSRKSLLAPQIALVSDLTPYWRGKSRITLVANLSSRIE